MTFFFSKKFIEITREAKLSLAYVKQITTPCLYMNILLHTLSPTLTLAPRAIKLHASFVCPLPAAQTNAVMWKFPCEFMSAPRSNNILAKMVYPQ